MNGRVVEVVERLERARTPETLLSCIRALRDIYRVEHFVYHRVAGTGDPFGCGTYPPDWAERYARRDYLRVDPVVAGCFRRFHPVDWKGLDWSGRAARDYLRDAIAHGVGTQGYSIPIRGPAGQFALFTANHSCDDAAWAAFTRKHRRDLILLAHLFNQKALELEPDRRLPASQSLSPREIEAITLLAMGYSRAQVAQSLSISEHTLRGYIEGARHKLGALNTTHAVARALSRGLIVL